MFRKSARRKIRLLKQWSKGISQKTTDRVTLVFIKRLVKIINILPIRIGIGILENLNITGKLDYPGCDIRMGLTSYIQLRRLEACAKEPETVAWIETNLKTGEVFYDIGANVGAYSFVAFSITSGKSKIYAFEPSFSTFSALCYNICINDCKGRIVPLNIALSDKTELLNINYTSLIPGSSCHNFDGKHTATVAQKLSRGFSCPVVCYKLDDIIESFGLPKPNHIKIDVDGPELDILNGAEKTLSSSGLHSILIEIDEPLRDGIVEKLAANSFKIQSIHRRSETISNYIFIKES